MTGLWACSRPARLSSVALTLPPFLLPLPAAEEPDDVVTGAEAAEAALPSAGPASGPHPHAPSKVLAAAGAAGNAAGAAGGEGAAVGQLAGPAVVLGAEQRAELRAGVNKRYSAAVQAAEVEEMHALLGSEHIFICRTV